MLIDFNLSRLSGVNLRDRTATVPHGLRIFQSQNAVRQRFERLLALGPSHFPQSKIIKSTAYKVRNATN
jgi:hypothetical protein